MKRDLIDLIVFILIKISNKISQFGFWMHLEIP